MTEDYSQPDFYRFNSDSIDLIKWIQDRKIKPKNILDLGAGCGILGIELSRHLGPQRVTLVELQEDFRIHLEKNCHLFLNPDVEAEIMVSSFANFKSLQQFDLIVCNPPYYLPGRGELPRKPQRALARTFLQDSWIDLLQSIRIHLAPQGRCYLVLKKESSLLEQVESLGRKCGLSVIQYELSSDMILEFALDEK